MRPLKILSVDDDATLRMLLKAFIGSLGHQCSVVSNGEEALRRYQQEPFDLILVDQLMPGMDGIGVTRAIRELQTDRGWRPIIMLSGMSETDDQVASLDAGCDDFIAKPVNLAILAAKINAFRRIAALQEQVAEQNQQLLHYHHAEAEERRICRFLMERLVRRDLLEHPQVRHLLQAASEVSGDLLLVCPASNGDLYVMLADATGHGLPAALTLIPLSQTFYAMASKGFKLETIARELNLRNRAYSPADRFVAALLAVLRPREDVLSVWNGGIPAALLVDEQGQVVRRFKSLNLPLGIVADGEFESECETVAIESGQRLLLYSDGLIEAENAQGEPFGTARLERCLSSAPLSHWMEELQQRLGQHLDGCLPHDDLSCLLLECRGEARTACRPALAGDGVAESWSLQLTLTAPQLQRLDAAPMVSNLCNSLGLPAERQGVLALILNELLSNALDHGVLGLDSAIKDQAEGFERYFETRALRLAALQEGEIRIDIQQHGSPSGNHLQVQIHDSGAGFDIDRLFSPPAAHAPRLYHGRGLTLVRQLCQHLEFYPPGNRVRAQLHWGSDSSSGLEPAEDRHPQGTP
ncbi:MAG: fused response regulator/phosphatase [Pseudomonas sp.]|uniref:ATP-binding SpoIIE family protein phosphatase n=1 Tax=Pseudomonas sp. TaxID=306 RepID=UPI0033947EA5